MVTLTKTPAWQALQSHSEFFKQADFRLDKLFDDKEDRFDNFSLQHEDLLLDYSKNFVTEQTLKILLDLAHQQGLVAAIAAMFNGDPINNSEQRAALHVALRDPATEQRFEEVTATLERMQKFVTDVHAGRWTGYSGKPIRDVVNIGVGGSDLGPALAVEALQRFSSGHTRAHFISNIDPSHNASVLATLDPETTLFVVASKTFSTLETRQNTEAARNWLLHQTDQTAVARHFIAVTANPPAAVEFGIDQANIFPLWDWVGGRFSLWSAIGLPIALHIGMDNFRDLLRGAHGMDLHFRNAELQHNLPVVMALMAIWYRGFFDSHSCAVVPYSHQLRFLPAYLQQLHMESLGKRVDKLHRQVGTATGEPLWGAVGSDVQHSCFQLLHQGTEFVPVDFIAIARSSSTGGEEAHRHLLANCFSQSLALMRGQTETIAPYRNVPGNRPSSTLLLAELNPYNLGSLLALFEHKVYVQSVIWNINAFDQWGVELGKSLSGDVYAALSEAHPSTKFDSSTANLLQCARNWAEKY